MGDWTFFSNHGHVLVCLARDSDARLRDVAVQVGITERAVQKIVRDLQGEGYLEVSKHGRRNRYRINNRKALRHPLQSGCTVGQLLNLFDKEETASRRAAVASPPAPPPEPEPEPAPEPAERPRPPTTEPRPPPQAEDREEDHPGERREDRKPGSDLEQGQLF